MIKITLSDDYLKDKEIINVFDKLAEKVFQKLNGKSVKCTYNQEDYELKTLDDIRKFLLAKDFYNYHFNIPLMLKFKNSFSYDNLLDTQRHLIISKMNVLVCPYCNMNYTFAYQNENHEHCRTTADLDHFYSKVKYPFYALCLYNFVPSCTVCNRTLKGDKDVIRETHIYPHDESFSDNAEFAIGNLIDVLVVDSDNDVDIVLNNLTDNEKCKNSNELFQIEARYKEFKNVASELLEKSQIYNESYRGELSNFSDLLGDKMSEEMLKKLIFGEKLSEAEMLNTSLGKFKNDLLKQFGILD